MALPTFQNQAVAGKKQDDIHNDVGSQVSSPTFVDNAVHHAVYSVSTDATTGKFSSVARPKSTDFQPTLPKTYSYEEQSASILLKHRRAGGVNSDTPVFFNNAELVTGVTPPLYLFADSDRILPFDITSDSSGSIVNLNNMRGETLSTMGLDSENQSLTAGQIVDVGLRTTDLAMRLFKDKKHSLNSVSIGRPYSASRTGTSTTNKGATLFRHSGQFVSKDLRSASMVNALRFLARHDHYTLFHDRFGNFIYAPYGFSQSDKSLRNELAANITADSIVDASNRIIVRGPTNALNSNNEAHVDDVEIQKRDGVIKTQVYTDPTANTRASARTTANQMLRLNRKAQGAFISSGQLDAWDVQPGQVVDFYHPVLKKNIRAAVVEATHVMSNRQSQLSLLSYEMGISDLMNTVNLDTIDMRESTAIGVDNTIKVVDMSAVGSMNLKVNGIIKVRQVASRSERTHSNPSQITLNETTNDIHSGFLIGHRLPDAGDAVSRSAIGTGLTPRLTGASFSGSTLTVSSTAGFPSAGQLVVNDTRHVAYTGKTSTTFTGVSVLAPTGASIPANNLTVRLLRGRGHEMGTVKMTNRGMIL
jgi:hypothetical protein